MVPSTSTPTQLSFSLSPHFRKASTRFSHHTTATYMATSSTNPPSYGLGRTNITFPTPAAAFNSTAKTQQRLEAERLERELKAREERERMEALGQNSLAELSEEQREEIHEAVRIITICAI